MNLKLYCLNCEFIGADQEEAARHRATSGHDVMPVRQGDVSPEEHTHKCPACRRNWGCDNPCCEEPVKSECDPCFRERMADDSIY